MNTQFDQLVDYIKQHSSQGISDETIRQALLQHNWDKESVDRAFALVKNPETQSHSDPEVKQPSPAAPQKYRVVDALQDTVDAIRNNTVTFLLTVIVSYGIAAVALMVISLLVERVAYSAVQSSSASLAGIMGVMVLSLVLNALWYALAYTFILTATSLAIDDGADRRQRSIGAILAESIAKFWPVMGANTLFALITFWPLILISLLPIVLLYASVGVMNTFIIMPLLILVALIWTVFALLRFPLAPYVALFEPEVPIVNTLGRSKHLLMKGGQWFLIKGLLLIIAILILLAILTGTNLKMVTSSDSIAINIVIVAISIIQNGALVMLYRNRKIVRGESRR